MLCSGLSRSRVTLKRLDFLTPFRPQIKPFQFSREYRKPLLARGRAPFCEGGLP